jgi:two-component system response regulator RpaA
VKTYTTGQVSKLCHVAPRTAAKWFDAGRIKGYRIPNSGATEKGRDRRVYHDELVAFLRAYGMDRIADEIEADIARTCLLVGVGEFDASRLRKSLLSVGVESVACRSLFTAGRRLADDKAKAAVFDASGVGTPEALRAAADTGCPAAVILAEDAPEPQTAAAVFRHPIDPDAIAAWAAGVLGQEKTGPTT